MGCDIHAAVEKKVGDHWVMIDRLEYPQKAVERNYKRFSALAGVRGTGPDPKGLPEDISESAKLFVEEWEGDGHSHSFLELTEAAKIFLATDFDRDGDFKNKYPLSYFFDIDDEKVQVGHYRLVFWFDN